ncbi:hypothetical protein KP509_23G033400 [Ceratopteris richardii]|nr:hypothetical protein KP509_23G033400 [Ceratopteris richardii]
MFVTEELVLSVWTTIHNLEVHDALRKQNNGVPSSVIPPLNSHPTCLSRSQQYLYRKSSHLSAVPESLRQAWSSYADMQKSCFHGNWTELFLNKHGPASSRPDSCRYLVFIEGREGLGNLLLSLTTAFTFAMATNRTLLIDSRGNVAKLLCEPFPETSWVLPTEFPYNLITDCPRLFSFQHNTTNASCVSLNLQHNITSPDKEFFCEDSFADLKHVTWVAWTSNQYFVTNLLLIPSFWQRMHPMMVEGRFFTYVSSLLLLPENKTWSLIVRQLWSYLSAAELRVGIQVRLHGRKDLAQFEPGVDTKIMDCLLRYGLLPSLSEYENSTEMHRVQSRKMSDGKKPVDILLLLTSLQGKYSQVMRDRFMEMPTESFQTVQVHSVSQLGRQDKGFQQAQLAFVEMWLLSFCDFLATSEYSTFGYIAQGLADLHPYILTLKSSHNPSSCMVGQSSEPCTHYPKVPTCLRKDSALSPAHKDWIRVYLRMCQDQPSGWQLVQPDAGGDAVPMEFL